MADADDFRSEVLCANSFQPLMDHIEQELRKLLPEAHLSYHLSSAGHLLMITLWIPPTNLITELRIQLLAKEYDQKSRFTNDLTKVMLLVDTKGLR